MATQEQKEHPVLGGFLGIAMLVGIVFLVRGCAGCGGTKPDSPVDDAEPKPKLKSDLGDEAAPKRKRKSDLGGTPGQENQALDFTGLRGVLNGKWKSKKESKWSEAEIIEFTEKSIETKSYHVVGKYEMKGDLLRITDRDGASNIYGLEFLSDGEFSLRPEKLENGTSFNDIQGQWQRISMPTGKAVLGTGPIADAKRRVQKIEQLLARREGILKSALANRDELAEKLRSVGVNCLPT